MSRPDPARVLADLDAAERDLQRATDRAVKHFLDQTTAEAIAGLQDGLILVAAARGELTLGEMYGWWTAAVQERINPAIAAAWRTGYKRQRAADIIGSSLDSLATYIASVADRLVQGIQPPLPDDAFNTVRLAVTNGAAQGMSTKQLAGRIAKELSWETDAPYWRAQLAAANNAIDAILDPIGPPGNAARELARLNDPLVAAHQADRARAVIHLDAEASHWKTRATRIARTESTGAYNYGALNALSDEGSRCVEWMATGDNRTRLTHRSADGQVVRTGTAFSVGGASLRMPGDPSGPPQEVINCRCTIVGADTC